MTGLWSYAVYSVKEGSLYDDDVLLGDANAIYVDSRQHDMLNFVKRDLYPSQWPRFVVKQLPTADYLFVTASGLVVGIESKTANDFMTSRLIQKLQRQSRELMDAVDIPMWGLMLRPGEEWETRCLVDMVKGQAMGGSIQVLPWDMFQTAELLVDLRTIMQPGTHLSTILQGDDWKRPEEIKLAPCATALRRLFVGVGVKIALLLDNHFEGDIIRALSASDEEWKQAAPRMHNGILDQRRKLCNKI